MSLAAYNKKRDFKKTSEPRSGKSRGGTHAFVVQRHHASRLHYDFRLEVNGTLKSWAVPKGPSLDPADKRLAMEVEDHPYDYKDFEGEIPPGNYGAGYVHIWDQGTYELLDDKGKDFDRQALQEWRSGSLKIILHGKKLKGEFALVKMKGKEENTWLLIKHRDRYAKEGYDSEDHTPKRIKEKLKGPENNKAAEKRGTRASAAKRAKAPAKRSAMPAPKPGRAKMKDIYKPMLATLVDAPFDREGWVFETKWDGYRAIANVRDGEAALYSRNRLSFNEMFPPVVKAVEKIPHNVVLDGEVVVLGAKGRSDFQALQQYKTTGKGKLAYAVFDLLYLDGHHLEDMALTERKALLEEIVRQLNDPVVQYSGHKAVKGIKLFEDAVKAGWEGIIAKNGESNYAEGVRSQNWLKIKVLNRQEAIICGYTDPRGSRKRMGALILGVYDDGKLRYAGHCGGGFNQQSLKEMYERLQPYRRETSPFSTKIKTNMPVTWVEPELVCEVKFSEWTGEGIFRQPIFVAMREDKPAAEVKKELPKHLKTMADTRKKKSAAVKRASGKPPAATGKKSGGRSSAASAAKKAAPAAKSRARKSGPSAKAGTKAGDSNERSLRLGNRTVALTNQQKVYWPDEKITKGELIDYYLSVADYLLPYLKDRPLSLHRFPNGIKGMSFYQKDLDLGSVPSWLKTFPVLSESTGKHVDYLICNNTATLAYMINLGCIEINPWLSRTAKPDYPDYIVIDLDPEDIAFEHVVDTANAVHNILEGYNIQSFVKTSGASGMHIYIPTGAKYAYETCRLFAEYIANEAHAQLPEVTSVIRAKSRRKKKVYIDFLQNSRGQTIAAPYSARPRPGATVSTPLHWKEVNKKLDIRNFHIGNTLKRLEKHGDIWDGISRVKNNLKTVLKK